MAHWHEYRSFPASTPRQARGGIKARSKRGAFSETWWGKRWIAVLESFNLGTRLQRGRTYARKGQVLSVQIDAGKVAAKVQGSRARPYEVSIALKEIPALGWKTLGKAVSADVAVAAKLMAGEMPQDLEAVFAKAGVPLFPSRAADLRTSCSCPDYSNPCKHIAAVYYLLAEEFDRDPFLLLRLRGRSREEFVALLGAPAGSSRVGSSTARRATEPTKAPPPAQPLPADPAAFWTAPPLPADIFGGVPAPSKEPPPLATRLGPFPFWRGGEDFLAEISETTHLAAQRGMTALLAEAAEPHQSGDRER